MIVIQLLTAQGVLEPPRHSIRLIPPRVRSARKKVRLSMNHGNHRLVDVMQSAVGGRWIHIFLRDYGFLKRQRVDHNSDTAFCRAGYPRTS